MASIFISYRRETASGHAGRLFDRLAKRFGSSSVFYDRDSISLGSLWEERTLKSLSECLGVIVIIDKTWELAIQRAESFARREVLLAIDASISLFPVLVDRETPPRREDLPVELRPLLAYQAKYLPAEQRLFEEAVRDLCATLDDFGMRKESSRLKLANGLKLLGEGDYTEARKSLEAIARDDSSSAQASFYIALSVLAGRSFDVLRPSERREFERLLQVARRRSPEWLPPLVVLAILEIDYYAEHGMESDNDISVGEVAKRVESSPRCEEDFMFVDFVPASPQALRALQVDSGKEGWS